MIGGRPSKLTTDENIETIVILHVQSRNQEKFYAMEDSTITEAKKASKRKIKPMILALFVVLGIVYINWVRYSQTVDQDYRLVNLATLHERVVRKRPELWRTK